MDSSQAQAKTVEELQAELNKIRVDIVRVTGEMVLLAERQRMVMCSIVRSLGEAAEGG